MSREIHINPETMQVVITFEGCSFHFTNEMNPVESMSRRAKLVAIALLNDALQDLEKEEL